MKINQFIIFFLLIPLFPNFLLAQKRKISGYVYDALSHERLIGAHVWQKPGKVGTATNAYGYFVFEINTSIEFEQALWASYVGYESAKVLVSESDTVLHVYLKPSNELKTVTVVAKRENPIEKRNQISTISIAAKDLELLPTMGGERDVLKAYQLMPGVQTGNEGFSALYVRGGSPDQNLILLDDVPLYYVNHLGGFAGIFNSDAINSTQLIKGGFPAQYGTRLSSVLDVKMNEGNKRNHGGGFTVGMLTSKILADGPVRSDTASYLISARRFMYDLFMRPLTYLVSDGKASMGYTFYDVNAKYHQMLNSRNNIYFSFYAGDDVFALRLREKDESSSTVRNRQAWGNIMGAFRWNRVYSNSAFGNTVVSYSRYRYRTDFESEQKSSETRFLSERFFYSGVQDFRVQKNIEHRLNNHFQLKYGLNGTYHTYTPGQNRQAEEVNGNTVFSEDRDANRVNAIETALFLENRIDLTGGFSANVGLRLANYAILGGKSFVSVEPRVLLGYLLFNRLKISTAYSRMQQNVHMLSSTATFIPADFWMPATDKAPPSVSDQFTVGLNATLSEEYELSCEFFHKTMNNLIAFKEGTSFTGIDNRWEEKIATQGQGLVYGLEFLIQKQIGKTTGWIGYTFSRNTRTFNDLNHGNAFPFTYDRTHDFSLVFNRKISRRADFSATWVYGSGNALTFPLGKYNLENVGPYDFENNYDEEVYLYGDKNSVRAEAYHRLDIGFNFRREKLRGTRTWNISIYNVYNRRNPYSYYPNEISSVNVNEVKVSRRTLFPFMPSVSYSFVFK